MLEVFDNPASNEILEGILELMDDLVRSEALIHLSIIQDGKDGYFINLNQACEPYVKKNVNLLKLANSKKLDNMINFIISFNF